MTALRTFLRVCCLLLVAVLATGAHAQSGRTESGPVVEVSSPSPNPFTASTRFTLRVAQPAEVRVELYNLLGQRVREVLEARVEPGERRPLEVAAEDLPAGLYLLRVAVGRTVVTRQVTLVR